MCVVPCFELYHTKKDPQHMNGAKPQHRTHHFNREGDQPDDSNEDRPFSGILAIDSLYAPGNMFVLVIVQYITLSRLQDCLVKDIVISLSSTLHVHGSKFIFVQNYQLSIAVYNTIHPLSQAAEVHDMRVGFTHSLSHVLAVLSMSLLISQNTSGG